MFQLSSRPFLVKSRNQCSRLATPTALFADLADQTWVRTIEGDHPNLLGAFEANLSAMEKLHAERVIQLARRYEKAE